jgi:hypothetical protein
MNELASKHCSPQRGPAWIASAILMLLMMATILAATARV